MIRIDKPRRPPDVLLNRGIKQTEKDKAAYDNNPDDYLSGRDKFPLKDAIYGHVSVKDVQLNSQHGKCCYCEKISRGEIEHYRPKGAVKQSSNSAIRYPGYYWLAYDWDNLLVSCTDCNRSKSTLFPLEDEAARARSHHDNIQDEKPLFINPAKDDPREHIIFRGKEPVPVTESGRKTIECLKLRRPDLQEARIDRLTTLENLRNLIVAGENSDNQNMLDQINTAKKYLEKAKRPEAQFSSMVLDFLNSTSSIQPRTPIG